MVPAVACDSSHGSRNRLRTLRLNRCRWFSTIADNRPAGKAMTSAPSENTSVVLIRLGRSESVNSSTKDLRPENSPIW
jgi:hypothetical protein